MRVERPTGIAIYPKNLIHGLREWVERQFNIVHWTQLLSGGHFGEVDESKLLAGKRHLRLPAFSVKSSAK
jgi:epoxide hydrolase